MNNLYTQNRGGWFKNVVGTGAAIGTVVIMLSNPVEASVGTGGANVIQAPHNHQHLTPASLKYICAIPPTERSIPQNIDRIREILKPTLSDLAAIFGVSRQAIYNWLAGDYPIEEHVLKIEDMAAAAEIFATEGIPVTGSIIRRKAFSGKSLLDIAQAGGSAKDSAQALVVILRREAEQRKTMANRLATRTPATTNDADMGAVAVNELI